MTEKPNGDLDRPAYPQVGSASCESGMTLREDAAIRLRVPTSGNPKLDAMIRRSLRNEFAGRAMAVWIDLMVREGLSDESKASLNLNTKSTVWDTAARVACKHADSMLAELERNRDVTTRSQL